MAIESNPENLRLPRDVRNYRSNVDTDSHSHGEVRKIVRGRGVGIPQNGPSSDVKPFGVYRKFAHFHEATNKKMPERLGGGLDLDPPKHLATLPKPDPGTSFDWDKPGAGKVHVVVRADGAVVHENPDGSENHDVHDYMHAIFDDILYTTRRLLEAINQALETYADDPTPATKAGYGVAVSAFDSFNDSLKPLGSSPYSKAFSDAQILPVVTNEGFIVSARIKLKWKNPFHSSSTIKIP